MNPSYKRDMNCNYMILESPVQVQGNEYQIRMLLTNNIPGLLVCKMRFMDGKVSFYYEITSKQPLSRMFSMFPISKEDIRQILFGIKKGMEGTKQYLLDTQNLLLGPDYIYMEPETRDVYLCCLPFYEGEVIEEFRNLSEFILKNLDHSDEEAVILGYEIYSKTVQENYSIEEILYKIYERERTEKPDLPKEEIKSSELVRSPELIEKKLTERELIEKDLMGKQKEEVEPKKEKKKKIYDKKKVFYMACGVLSFMGLVLGMKAADLTLTQIGGILFFCFGLMMYLSQNSKKRKQGEKNRKKERERGPKSHPDIYQEYQEDFDVQINQREETEDVREAYGETVVLIEKEEHAFPILVSKEPDKRKHISLDQQQMIIGKLKEQVDISISAKSISRIHANIQKKEGGFYLRDLNSRNGTFLNGRRLEENEIKKLEDGDEVSFADAGYFFKE